MSPTPDVEPLSKRDSPLDPSVRDKLAKSDSFEKVGFSASVGGPQAVFKGDGDEFVIWGPASVEVVDKEGDRIRAKALADALPQLLKRARLSLEHSDQLVGKILEGFEVDEPVTVEIGDNEYERKEFPTDVLELEGRKPALYVAGEIYNDTRQAQETRDRIKNGELDSYSISGEALVTRKKIEDGEAYDDIVDLDLSAVTICEDGMNQQAKFGTVRDDEGDKETVKIDGGDETDTDEPAPRTVQAGGGPQSVNAVQATAKSDSIMTDGDNGGSTGEAGQALRETLKGVLDERLPDGDLATKNDVEQTIKEMAEEGDIPRPGETGENPKTTGPSQGDDRQGSETGEGSDGSDEELNEDVESPQEKSADIKSIVRETLKEEDILVDDDAEEGEAAPAPEDEEPLGDESESAEDEDEGEGEEIPDEGGEPDIEAAAKTLAAGTDLDKDDVLELVEEKEVGGEKPRDSVTPEGEEEDLEGEEDNDYEKSGLSLDELEEQLPADVYEVVREYVDEPAEDPAEAPDEGGPEEGGPEEGGAPGEEALEAAEKSDDESVENMVKSILDGEGVTQVSGPSVDAGEGVEKSYSEEDDTSADQHGENPALANFY